MRYDFVLYFSSISKVVNLHRTYKEWSDRTLLGTIQPRAVYWSGVTKKFGTSFVVENVVILTFRAYCLWDSYSAIHTVHYNNTQTNSLPPHNARSLWHLPLARKDSWTYLLTCCVQQFRADYRLLTAAVLWFWKLKRRALCWICAGVYRYLATERGNMSVDFVGAEG